MRMQRPRPNRTGGSRLRLLPAMLLTSSLLASCTTLGSGTSGYVDTSCSAFQPITYSKSDTPETVTEIRAHNRVFDALCPATSH